MGGSSGTSAPSEPRPRRDRAEIAPHADARFRGDRTTRGAGVVTAHNVPRATARPPRGRYETRWSFLGSYAKGYFPKNVSKTDDDALRTACDDATKAIAINAARAPALEGEASAAASAGTGAVTVDLHAIDTAAAARGFSLGWGWSAAAAAAALFVGAPLWALRRHAQRRGRTTRCAPLGSGIGLGSADDYSAAALLGDLSDTSPAGAGTYAPPLAR